MGRAVATAVIVAQILGCDARSAPDTVLAVPTDAAVDNDIADEHVELEVPVEDLAEPNSPRPYVDLELPR